MEKVSIIIPVYKVEKYLPETVNSVFAQTYWNLEIILIDDGSPDSCPQLCDDYAQQDNRIRVIHKKNGGLSSARNAGLDVATGDYVMFLDSDDLYDNNLVETLVSLKKETKADVTAAEFQRFEDGTHNYDIIQKFHVNSTNYSYEGLDYYKRLITRDTDCSVCNKLFDGNLLKGKRFREGRNNEDYLFLFNLRDKVRIVAYTNKCFYKYRIRNNSITNSTLNSHTFDVLDNVIEIEEEINRENLDLSKEIREYKNSVCLGLLTFIYKNSLKAECRERYNYCRKQVRRDIVFILLNPRYTLQEKAKFLFVASM